MSIPPTIEPAAPAAATDVVPPAGTDDTNKPEQFEVPESVQRLIKSLGMDGDSAASDEPKPKDDKPAVEPKPKPAGDPKPKAGDAPPVPAADDRPLTVRREKIARPELPVIAAPAPKTPTSDPSAEFKPDPNWEKTLEENEREMLDDAREAERLYPDRYKGLTSRTAKFIRDHTELTAKEEFDDQDPKYKAWLDANQPKLTRKEIREIETARATTSVKQEFDGKFADLHHKTFVRDQEPKLADEGRAVFAELVNSALPEELAKEIKANGLDKAREVYGLDIETAQTVVSIATDDIMEFRRITMKDPETGRPLQPIMERPPTGDPDDPAVQREMQRYEQHKRLGQLVDFLCEDFKKTGTADQQRRNGKWYVTRDEMQRIQPARRGEFWTFTNAELIERAKKNVPFSVKEAISRRREQMTKLGWQPPQPKVAAPPPKKDDPPPTPTGSPRVPTPSPVPAGADPMADIDARAKRMAAQLGRE